MLVIQVDGVVFMPDLVAAMGEVEDYSSLELTLQWLKSMLQRC